jgi:hypothetical protein
MIDLGQIRNKKIDIKNKKHQKIVIVAGKPVKHHLDPDHIIKKINIEIKEIEIVIIIEILDIEIKEIEIIEIEEIEEIIEIEIMMIEEIEMIEIEEDKDKNIDKKKEIIIIRMILKFNKIKLYL